MSDWIVFDCLLTLLMVGLWQAVTRGKRLVFVSVFVSVLALLQLPSFINIPSFVVAGGVLGLKLQLCLAILCLWSRGLKIGTLRQICQQMMPLLLSSVVCLAAFLLAFFASAELPLRAQVLLGINIGIFFATLLGFLELHRHRLLQGGRLLTCSVFGFIGLVYGAFLLCFLLRPLPGTISYLRWLPLLLTGSALILLNEQRIHTSARQEKLESFQALQRKQFEYVTTAAENLDRMRRLRHDVYNYIQTARWLSSSEDANHQAEAERLLRQAEAVLAEIGGGADDVV